MSKFIEMLKAHDIEVSFTYQLSTCKEDDEIVGISFYLPLGNGETVIRDIYNQLLEELGKKKISH